MPLHTAGLSLRDDRAFIICTPPSRNPQNVGRIRESCMDNETSTKLVGPPRRGGRHGSPLTRQSLSMAARSASGPYQFCRMHDSQMRTGATLANLCPSLPPTEMLY